MKRRAKFMPKSSMRERVAEFDRERIEPVRVVAKALMLTTQQVHSARAANKKCSADLRHALLPEPPMTEKEITTIAKIGVDKAERIVRLLKLARSVMQ